MDPKAEAAEAADGKKAKDAPRSQGDESADLPDEDTQGSPRRIASDPSSSANQESPLDIESELGHLARRIRKWRADAGLTLHVLGARSGVAASTIHKIENCQTVPTIAVLLKVVHALGREPEALLLDSHDTTNVVHTSASERRELDSETGSKIEQLSRGIATGTLDVWRITHPPGQGMDPDHTDFRFRYDGELLILCEEGILSVKVGNTSYALGPGDTLHFKTSLPHLWRNAGSAPAQALLFGSRPGGLHRGIAQGIKSLGD
jgi:transcriptional regulator with XRE-family HTH domain